MTINNGDLAEYVGDHEPLRGKRCTVDSWTPKRTRVRVIVLVSGVFVMRSVKPENLKKVGGGGCLKARMGAEG